MSSLTPAGLDGATGLILVPAPQAPQTASILLLSVAALNGLTM